MSFAINTATGLLSKYLFENRDAVGLSALTGYEVELIAGSEDTLAILWLSQTARERLFTARAVTLSKQLENALQNLFAFKNARISEQDISRE